MPYRFYLWILTLVFFATPSAFSQTEFDSQVDGPQLLNESKSRYWQVFGEELLNGFSTYASSYPLQLTNITGRDTSQVFLQVVSQKNQDRWVVISMGIDLTDSNETHHTAYVDGNAYPLYMDESQQFLFYTFDRHGSSRDEQFIQALRRGKRVKIVSTSHQGVVISDEYSLTGSQNMIDSSAELINEIEINTYLNPKD